MTLKVGDKLYYSEMRWVAREQKLVVVELTVNKIGRKYAHVDHDKRVSLNDMRLLCWNNSRQVFRSREEHDDDHRRWVLWNAIRTKIDRMHSVPADVDIDAIAKILGLAS